MSYREGQFHIKQTPHYDCPCNPIPNHPWAPTTTWQSFMYSFGHYSMSRTTWSYRIPFDRQLEILVTYVQLKVFILCSDTEKLTKTKTWRCCRVRFQWLWTGLTEIATCCNTIIHTASLLQHDSAERGIWPSVVVSSFRAGVMTQLCVSLPTPLLSHIMIVVKDTKT